MRRTAVAIATALCLAVAGCGSDDGPSAAPVACTAAPQGYLKALRSAPDAVLLGQQTPISECLVDDQGAGDLADIGQRLVEAATELNKQARKDPGGAATVQLGYLVGAVEQGSSTTSGIHSELVRRLESSANFFPGGDDPGAAFDDAYENGYAAGQETG